MKRFRIFRIQSCPFSDWSTRRSGGQWKLGRSKKRGDLVFTSWHQCWNHALADYSVQVTSQNYHDDALIVSAEKGIVLAAICTSKLQGQFMDEYNQTLWTSSLARKTGQEALATADEKPIYANLNQLDIAWVTIPGAPLEVPCRLGILERRARRNPDGFYGRLHARKNEFLDFFRRG